MTRARDLGIPFEGTPGNGNAITDVQGVTVGYAPVIEGPSARTGVPIIPVGMGGTERALGKGARWIKPTKVVLIVGEPLLPPTRGAGRICSSRRTRRRRRQGSPIRYRTGAAAV